MLCGSPRRSGSDLRCEGCQAENREIVLRDSAVVVSVARPCKLRFKGVGGEMEAPKAERFMREYIELCRKHGLRLEHDGDEWNVAEEKGYMELFEDGTFGIVVGNGVEK